MTSTLRIDPFTSFNAFRSALRNAYAFQRVDVQALNKLSDFEDKRWQEVARRICQLAAAGSIPYAYYNAAYGLLWAITSGRYSDGLLRLRAMKVNDLLTFIQEIATNTKVIGDVPAFLYRSSISSPDIRALALSQA